MALHERGRSVGENRVARLMRIEDIRAKTVKKWRTTTDSQHQLPVTANARGRQFSVTAPNRVWPADITCLWTDKD